jgi:hypothetical protein
MMINNLIYELKTSNNYIKVKTENIYYANKRHWIILSINLERT